VRVLVWDDEQIWRQLVREKVEDVVRSMGRQPECHEVEKFSKALSMLSEGHWDLLVTDIADTEADKSSIGMNLADKARQLKIRCIVVSGDIVLTKKHTHTLGKMGAEYYAKGDFATSLDEFMNEVRKVCK
jgi:CheY-like chemotaxis protein